jgi:hypothetical protein
MVPERHSRNTYASRSCHKVRDAYRWKSLCATIVTFNGAIMRGKVFSLSSHQDHNGEQEREASETVAPPDEEKELVSSIVSPGDINIDTPKEENIMPEAMKQVYYDTFKDPYTQAGKRLDRLLSGLGDGEDELLDSMLMEQSVEKKIGLAVVAGSLVCGAAVLSCLFLELDPLGGAQLSISSLKAAGIGALASVPLCVFKNALWSDTAHKELPFLQELQKTQMDDFKPILSGLSFTQTGIIMACEVIPTILIVFPAFVGGIMNMLEMYRQASDGIQNSVPETIPPLVALTIVSLLSGISKLIDQGPSPEEYDVIKDALDNADRFYKVMAGPGENNESSKEAFKNVALLWLARRQVAARFAGAVSSFEIFYLGLLWFETGDLTAPMIAALALNAVDFIQMTRRIPNESIS